MSADNWKECPQCGANRASEEFSKHNDLQYNYGKISAEEYEAKRRELIEFLREVPEETLREDYEYQLDPSTCTLGVYYKCHCAVCDFGFKVQQDVDYLPLVTPPKPECPPNIILKETELLPECPHVPSAWTKKPVCKCGKVME